MKTLCSAVVRTVALVVLLNGVSSAPVSRRTAEANKKAANFFLKYGYIDKKSNDSRPTLHIEKAIMDLQKFGGLPVTGKLDQATLKLIGTKRCGVKDPVKKVKKVGAIQNQVGEFYLQGTFWKKTYLTYRFVRGKSTRDLPVDVQQNIIRRMIHKWDEASALTIREADPSIPDDKVDILISFVEGYHGDAYAFDGTGGTLAHAFYPHNNQGLSGDAHFDDAERFTTGTKDGINLDWVALHEFGHSLGLEHSNVRESVMYPWYKGYQGSNIELTNDDILGIRALYPVKRPVTKTTTKPTRAPRTTPSTQPTPTDPPTDPLTDAPTSTTIPSACKPRTKYDAVVMEKDRRGKSHTHFFHRELFWTLNERLQRGEPKRVSDYWPDVRTPIDAAYRNRKGNIVFFTGNQYWEYGNNRRLIGSGSLDRYGLSSDLTDMDAVFTWHRNKKTYFFKGEKYWRYNEENREIDPYYPREIRQGWPGLVEKDIDAAVTWRNSRSYIFSGEEYFRLQDKATGRMVYNDRGYPQITADEWMKCNDVGAIGALQSNNDI